MQDASPRPGGICSQELLLSVLPGGSLGINRCFEKSTADVGWSLRRKREGLSWYRSSCGGGVWCASDLAGELMDSDGVAGVIGILCIVSR